PLQYDDRTRRFAMAEDLGAFGNQLSIDRVVRLRAMDLQEADRALLARAHGLVTHATHSYSRWNSRMLRKNRRLLPCAAWRASGMNEGSSVALRVPNLTGPAPRSRNSYSSIVNR